MNKSKSSLLIILFVLIVPISLTAKKDNLKLFGTSYPNNKKCLFISTVNYTGEEIHNYYPNAIGVPSLKTIQTILAKLGYEVKEYHPSHYYEHTEFNIKKLIDEIAPSMKNYSIIIIQSHAGPGEDSFDWENYTFAGRGLHPRPECFREWASGETSSSPCQVSSTKCNPPEADKL